MKNGNAFYLLLFFFLQIIPISGQASEQTLFLDGVDEQIEIIVDHWGIPHIYARNEADLFVAQGFYAARDRLFQFEIWRRQATGTVAEILGPRELNRDIGTRLFQYRGDMTAEMKHYHEKGDLIIESYVKGVNAYIKESLKSPDKLPIEFKLLGILPQEWTPAVVISRHQGLLGNIGRELRTARLVHLAGIEKTKELSWFHPKDPDLNMDEKIDRQHLFGDILELYEAFRRPVRFRPEDVLSSARNWDRKNYENLVESQKAIDAENEKYSWMYMGSNNWVVDGSHTESGYPILANDPHRTQSVPSLRYMAHLVAPGWNVIGGGEPEIPGISIGHNNYGAWGLTVFQTDGEDLYVYELNPENPNQYRYEGAWESMKTIWDTIPVKDMDDQVVELKYSRHGPVCFIDTASHIAYAVRCAWLEKGGSPYLASLRMNQSRNFEEFREACSYSHIPGENMIWADRNGNIGFQAVGIAPIRRGWSGLVPVPGDGSYEWDGYLPIKAKPNVYNPEKGMIYTANANVTPPDYPYWEAIGYTWSDPYREGRVAELLRSGRKHSLADMARYQTDVLSIPARQLVPLLKYLNFEEQLATKCQEQLLNWDCSMDPNSVAAGIYNQWEKVIRTEMLNLVADENIRPYVSLQMKNIISWLILPDGKFGEYPELGRNRFLKNTFLSAIAELQGKLGSGLEDWRLGQPDYKHIYLKHPMSDAVNADLRKRLDVGPAIRGGSLYTLNNTSSSDNQTSGASFRIIVDTEDWDDCLGTNNPGQSGDPDSPFYDNLFENWSSDQFFPIFYSRSKIESVKNHSIILEPKK